MDRISRIAAVALTAALASGAAVQAAGAAGPTPVAVGASASDPQAVVEAFIGDHPGGAAALLVRDGTVTTVVAGSADAAGDPITDDTRFRVGSISKSFVATMVLQMVDEGLVDLDAPLGTYLPDTVLGADVPVRLLMRHRSGLPNYADDEAYNTDVLADLSRVFTPDELLGYVVDVPAVAADSQFLYANTNYVLLGQLVEAVDGVDLNTALTARITGPLGLTATEFAIGGQPAPDGVAGPWYFDTYTGDPTAPYDSTASGTWAAGALVSTTGDVATFLAALLGGDLVSADSLAAMTDQGEDGYGLGLMSLGFPSGRNALGHLGEVVGFLSAAAIEPESGDTFVVLTNNSELPALDLAAALTADW